MNKIEVVSDNVILNDVKDSITTYSDNGILIINCKKDSEVLLINNVYKEIVIEVSNDVVLNILEIKNASNNILNYKYILNDNSKAIINKFYYLNKYNENIDINLNGYASDVIFNLSVASFDNQKYNINVYHNNKKTVSNIFNHGVTFDNSSIDFTINGTIKKGMKDSILNQDNKIMVMGNGKSVINPNLFVDDDLIEARHGASIGKFSEDEIFYLETRGIPRDIGYQLLMKGFLLNTLVVNVETLKELETIVEKLRR